MATTATKMQKITNTNKTDNQQWLLSVRSHGSIFEALHCVFCSSKELGPKFCEFVRHASRSEAHDGPDRRF